MTIKMFRVSFVVLILMFLFLSFSLGVTWKEAFIFLILAFWFLFNKKKGFGLFLPLISSVILLIFKLSFELFNSNIEYPGVMLGGGRVLFCLALGFIIIKEILAFIFNREKTPFEIGNFDVVIFIAVILFSLVAISIGLFSHKVKLIFIIVFSLLGCLGLVKSIKRDKNILFFLKCFLIIFISVSLFSFVRAGLAIERYYKAKVYKNLGFLDKAEEELKKAIFLNPIFKSAYLELSDTYRSKEDFERAVDTYRRLFKAAGVDPKGYYKLGDLYIKRGEWAKASEMYEYSLTLDNKLSSDINFKLAITYEKLGYFDRASVEYAKSFKKRSDKLEAFRKLIKIYQEKNLLNNGGFEEWDEKNSLKDWKVDQSIMKKIKNCIEGNYCMKQITQVPYANVIAEVKVLPEVKYKFSIYSHIEGRSIGMVDIWSNRGRRLLENQEIMIKNKEWQRIESMFDTGPEDSTVIIYLQGLNQGDRVFWDRAELKAVDIDKDTLKNIVLR